MIKLPHLANWDEVEKMKNGRKSAQCQMENSKNIPIILLGSGETTLPFPQKIKELLSLDWAVGVPQQARAGMTNGERSRAE
ncbi:MAG: hypothetical protein WCI88_12075 [Chloroflexota bacterium]